MNRLKLHINTWGRLFVIATPIGNMEDITFRAIRILSFVDLVLSEDTRITGRLLSFYGIKTKLESLYEYNEKSKIIKIINEIKLNKNIALVSDSGTPLISDPGYRLVCKAIHFYIKVVPIPGPSALISSISAAGLPSNSFIFLGFFRKKRRLNKLKKLCLETKTLVFYESPKKIIMLFYEILKVLGDRNIVLSREMTKIHEEFIRGNISLIISTLKNKYKIKGECTLLISGKEVYNLKNKIDIKRMLFKNNRGNIISTFDVARLLLEKCNDLLIKDVYNILLKSRKSFFEFKNIK